MNPIAAYASRIFALVLGTEHNGRASLIAAARVVQKEAKSAIGTYKYGWPPLNAATVARKRTGDSPLLETGTMREGIVVQPIDHHNVGVVATDGKLAWHEFGTMHIPPRPVLGPAAESVSGVAAGEVNKGLVLALHAG